MTIIEDGTGLPDANSYADVATADAYFEARFVEGWNDQIPSAAREGALIRATDFIDANYVFVGVPLTDTQALANPRDHETHVFSKAVVKATIELAYIALTTDLFAPIAREVKSTQESLGSLSSRTEYAETKASDPYPHITAILKGVARRRGVGASMGFML